MKDSDCKMDNTALAVRLGWLGRVRDMYMS